jgi:hypothetical protein
MPAVRLLLAVAVIAPLLVPVATPAAADTFGTEYSVTLAGVPIGRASLHAEFLDGRYAVAFSGRVKGLARLFSDGHAAAAATGEVRAGSFHPNEYRHEWTEEDDTETVRVGFRDLQVDEIVVEPPPRHPERDVRVTAAHKRNVIDPASAFLWPAPAGAAPETCERTLAVFNGRHRFDLAFAYSRAETFRARDRSYSGPAIICAMRYHPVSGHRANKKSVRFMADNRDMEVWMAPAGAGIVAPVKIRIRTRFGWLVLEARQFSAS